MAVYPGAMLPALITLAVVVVVLVAAHVYLNPPVSPPPPELVSQPRPAASLAEAEAYIAAGGRVYGIRDDGALVPVTAPWLTPPSRTHPFWLMPPNTVPACSYTDCALWSRANGDSEVWRLNSAGEYGPTICTAEDFKIAGPAFRPFTYFLVDAR